jgi:Restriction endonuclease BglII
VRLPGWLDAQLDGLEAGGGQKTKMVGALETLFRGEGWEKENFERETRISTRSGSVPSTPTKDETHEVDFFRVGAVSGAPLPGIGLEIQWNSKDGVFGRDLGTFQDLHRSRAVAVAIWVTRGPTLQAALNAWEGDLIRAGKIKSGKFGASTTHWAKLRSLLVRSVEGLPVLAVGVEPDRVAGIPSRYVPSTPVSP